MPPRRGRGPIVSVDERTAEMTDEALLCRRYGGRHALMPVLKSARRRAKLAALGQIESVSRCMRDCGYSKTELFDFDGNLLESKTEYAKEGYLIKGRGQGRLPVNEARKAFFSRRPSMG